MNGHVFIFMESADDRKNCVRRRTSVATNRKRVICAVSEATTYLMVSYKVPTIKNIYKCDKYRPLLIISYFQGENSFSPQSLEQNETFQNSSNS